MKRALLVLLLAAVAGCAMHEQVTATEADQLRAKIADLQGQVERLHQKTEILEKLVVLTPDVVRQRLLADNVPPGGREFNFNGSRYFVVPLTETTSAEPYASTNGAAPHR